MNRWVQYFLSIVSQHSHERGGREEGSGQFNEKCNLAQSTLPWMVFCDHTKFNPDDEVT